MFRQISKILQLTNRQAGKILVVGLVAVTWRSWRLWQHDRALLIRKMSSPRSSSFMAWPRTPKVSVLVAAWNEAEQIESHIRSFLDLGYPDKELILCAGGPDGTNALARRWANPQVIILQQHPGEGKQRALQRCLAYANGSIILLTDADCVFSNETFSRLIAPIIWGKARVATGVSEPKLHQRGSALVQYQWFRDLAWSSQMPQTVDGVLGRNCALLRSVLDDVGGFDAPVRTGTDYFLSRLLVQAGYQIQAVPDSRIATEYPDSPRTYLRMWRRWNKNLLIHGSQFGAWNDVRGVLVAFALYFSILSLPILSTLVGPTAWTTSLLLFSMANANRLRGLVAGAYLARRSISRRCLLLLPLYTCLDMLAVLLALRDAVDPKLRSRW